MKRLTRPEKSLRYVFKVSWSSKIVCVVACVMSSFEKAHQDIQEFQPHASRSENARTSQWWEQLIITVDGFFFSTIPRTTYLSKFSNKHFIYSALTLRQSRRFNLDVVVVCQLSFCCQNVGNACALQTQHPHFQGAANVNEVSRSPIQVSPPC